MSDMQQFEMIDYNLAAPQSVLMEATTKKSKIKDQDDCQLHRMIRQLTEPSDSIPEDSFDFFIHHANTLIRCLTRLSYRKSEKVTWRQLYLQCLKICLQRRQHQALIFHFKVVKGFWANGSQGSYRLQDLIHSANAVFDDYKKLVCKKMWPPFNQAQVLIDYYLKCENESKIKFLEKVVDLKCQYFSTLKTTSQDLYNHYFCFFKTAQNISIFCNAAAGYIRLVINRNNKETKPKFSIITIMSQMLKYFEVKESQNKEEFYLFYRVITQFTILLKKFQELQFHYFQTTDNRDFLEKVFRILAKMDPNDTKFALNNLMSAILQSRKQKYMMSLADKSAFLNNDCSLIDSYRYIATLLNEIYSLKSDPKSSDLSQITKATEYNLKLLVKKSQIAQLKEFLNFLYTELINFYRSARNILFANQTSYSYVQQCQNAYVKGYIRILPIYDLLIIVHDLLGEDQELKEYHEIHLQEKLKILLGAHKKMSTKESKAALMNFFNTCFLPYFQRNRPTYRTYLNTLRLFSHLSRLGIFQDISNKFLLAYVKIIIIGNYAKEEPLAHYCKIFAEIIQYLQDHQKNRLTFLNGLHFAANFVKLTTIGLIESEKQFRENDTPHYWEYYMQQNLEAFFFIYDRLQEQQAGSVTQHLLALMRKNYGYFLLITRIARFTAFNIIGQMSYCSQSRQSQLLNVLNFYQNSYQQLKDQLKLKDNISFIDFCFNIKTDLYNLYAFDSDELFTQSVETILNRIDVMEMTILETTASKYIQRQSLSITYKGAFSFIEVLSVAIKSIFFLIYEQRFYSRKSKQTGPKRGEDQFQYFRFEEQLELYTMKLVQIKQRCQKMLPYFKEVFYQLSNKTFFGPFEIKNIGIEYSRMVIAQINDLMYISHQCGIEELKSILLTIRLSLIYQYENHDIFLLQIAKYIFLGIFKSRQSIIINFLKEKIAELKQPNEFRAFIEVLLNGETSIEPPQQNILFNIFSIIKKDGLNFVLNFKQIANYFIPYLFKARFKVGDDNFKLLRPQMFLRPTTNIQRYRNSAEYFMNRCWEEGWMLTKMIVIISQKIIKASIDFHQISIVRNYHKFALFFYVRTAHICELKTPFRLAIKGNEAFNLMRVVDSIMKIQDSLISKVAYKQIDCMVYSKRSSIIKTNDNKIEIDTVYSAIEESFHRCSQTGQLLMEIFCQLAQQQLNLNAYQAFMHKNSIQILRNSLSTGGHQLWKYLNDLAQQNHPLTEYIKCIQEIADNLLNKILQNYKKATVLQDFIGEFIDFALKEESLQFLLPQDHQKIDSIIAKIGLAFEDYNYVLKKIIMNCPRSSIKELNLKQLSLRSEEVNAIFSKQCTEYYSSIMKKMLHLQKSIYPVSLIYPLGKKIFTISFHQKLLLTFTNRNIFEEKVKQCKIIIDKHRQVIYEEKTPNYCKQKMQMEAQLRKACQKIDIGIFDMNLSFVPLGVYLEYKRIDLNILKFVFNETEVSQAHFSIYCKRYNIKTENARTIRAKIKAKTPENCDLLLLIHQKYLQFPIETIRSVRQGRGVYRLPSVQYLLDNENSETQVEVKRCRYVVNSQDNLKDTEDRFLEIKKSFSQWKGMCRRQPDLQQIQMLLSQQLYLYMGHGSGFSHISDDDLAKLNPKCPMLVFGCSSAKMIFDFSEPFGSALTLLIKGCPAYLGCLWQVTDYDIDKITTEIFLGEGSQNLSLKIESARSKCFFPYMNASAVVIYGLPVYLKK